MKTTKLIDPSAQGYDAASESPVDDRADTSRLINEASHHGANGWLDLVATWALWLMLLTIWAVVAGVLVKGVCVMFLVGWHLL